ncbi:glycosyltransferase [Longimicrobium sp.]|uniref:glycosyltransferase n=1 Tax=Longimicrobium sp. TaxID=2029185 RepID=UPI002F959D90
MKIAIVSTMQGPPWAGSEELWARMAAAALGDGHQVMAFVHRSRELAPQLRELRESGAALYRRGRSYRLGLERLGSSFVRRPVRLPMVAPASPFAPLFRFGPDVVVLSEGTLFAFLHVGDLAEWLRRTDTPYVTVCQYLSDAHRATEEYRARAAAFYRGARTVGFVARGNLESAERQLAAALPNAVVLRNPVNLADRTPVPPPPPGPVRMASVGRLVVGDKGQDVLLHALSAPAWRARDWRLNLYGTGGDEGYLRALARHYSVAERVEFHGHVQDVRSIWARNELLVMPSRAEGTPLVLLEAMLCGRPSVCTDVGGMAEWVHEGRTGFLAEAPTPRSFGAALERAWAARREWPSMGRQAHEDAGRGIEPHPERTLLDLVARAAASRGRS